MANEALFQWDQEAAEENRILCEKGRRLLTVVVVVNLVISLLSAILHMQFMALLIQLVLAFFIFRGSAIARGFYILLAVLNILSGFLCLVWQNSMTNGAGSIGGDFAVVRRGFQLFSENLPVVSGLFIGIGAVSILWGIFMLYALMRNRNLKHYLDYQRGC